MPTDAELRALIARLRRDGTYHDPYEPETLGSIKNDGRNEAYLEIADELESLLRPQEPERAVVTCRECKRPIARDGDISHEGKCRRALAEKYGETGWSKDHDECARAAQKPERPELLLGRVEFPDPVTGEPRWRLATQEELSATKAAEPEQAARERLAAFLLAHPGAYYEDFDTMSAPPVRIALASVYCEGPRHFEPVDVERRTATEAINAALDAAERSRT